MNLLLPLFVGCGLLLAALAVPLILGKIPPNGIYGFRVRKTLEHPEVWYPVNQRGGRWFFATGMCVALAALGLAFLKLSLDVYALSVLGVLVVVFAMALADTIRYMNSL